MKLVQGIVAVFAAVACIIAGFYALQALTHGDWVGVLTGVAVAAVLLFYVAPRLRKSDSSGTQQ